MYGYTSVVPCTDICTCTYLCTPVLYNIVHSISCFVPYKVQVCTSTTTANKQGNPSDLMRGKQRVDPLSSQHLPAPRPSTLFSRKKIPRRGHLACVRTYCRSWKACPTQTGYVQVEPCSVLYKYWLPSQDWKTPSSVRPIPNTWSLPRSVS